MTTNPQPNGWPTDLLVWDNGGSWDGIAIPADDRPRAVVLLRTWLDDVGHGHEDPGSIYDDGEWARVTWDGSHYSRPRFERPDGTPTQYARAYAPEDLSYLPDMYEKGDS